MWYPAVADASSRPTVYTDYMGRADMGNLSAFEFPGRALRDAPVDLNAGPRPVVVLSHGYPGSRMLMCNLAENLSTKGYVVLAIGHKDNTYPDFIPVVSLESGLYHRTRDQRIVLEQLEQLNGEGFLKGLLVF